MNWSRDMDWCSPKEIYEARRYMEEKEENGCGCASGVKRGPYREGADIASRLDDHEGRLDVVEHILDGRAECSGDCALERVDELENMVKTIRVTLIALLIALVVVVIGALSLLDKLIEEGEMKFMEHEAVHLVQCNVLVR